MSYTFDNVWGAIQKHAERSAAAAVGYGAAPEIGVEIADRGRVKTGRLTGSVAAGKGSPPDGDVGEAPGPLSSYPPRHHPPPARADLVVEGVTIQDTVTITDTVPYAAARADQDNWIEPAIDAVGDRWPTVAEEGARRG